MDHWLILRKYKNLRNIWNLAKISNAFKLSRGIIFFIGVLVFVTYNFLPVVIAQSQSLSQDQRRSIIKNLSEDGRQIFSDMTQEEKKTFLKKEFKSLENKSSGKIKRSTSTTPLKDSADASKKPRGKRRGAAPTLVELGEVVRQPLIQIFPITGRLIASQKGIIAARITGSIKAIFVKVGDRVKYGQVIAELDVDRLILEEKLRAADVSQARAKLKSSQAQIDFLNQELKRFQRLRKSAAFSQARFDDKKQEIVKASSAADESAALLLRSQAQRGLAMIDLQNAIIKAPFPGAILVRHVSPGTYVNAGSPIVTLMDDESMEIEADVPSSRLYGLSEGRVINIQLNKNINFKAKIRTIIPDENPLARTRAVRLVPDLSGKKIKLIANQSVVLEVPQGMAREVITIPKDAVVNRQNGPVVFLFEGGSVRPISIEIGESFGGKFEILSGLQSGQKVVTKGNELLRPGQRVRVKLVGNGDRASTNFGAKRKKTGNGSINRKAIIEILSDKERQKFSSLSPEEKQKFLRKKIKESL